MHDSDGNTLSSEAFELKNVTDTSEYTFTVLEDSGINLDLSDVVAKNDNKAIDVTETGGADQIIPPTAANGAELKIAGTTYGYTTVADSEGYFVLDGDNVTGFVLGATGDRIVVDADSAFEVYDIDDTSEALDADVVVDGGQFVYTKTASDVEIGYVFTEAGNSVTLTEEQAEDFGINYLKKGVLYNVVEPEIDGGYTIMLTNLGKDTDTFVVTGLDEGASVTDSNGAMVTFEGDDGSVAFTSTPTETSSTTGTATFAIAGVSVDEGEIEFDAAAAALFETGLTVNGETVKFDPAKTLGTIAYNADLAIFSGLADGDAATIGSAMAVAIETDGDDEIKVNGVTYTIDGDEGSIVISGSGEVLGLDKGATLTVDQAAVLTVNGDKVTVSAGDEIVGYENKSNAIGAYVSDPNHPLITSADDAYDVIEKLGVKTPDVLAYEDAGTTTYDFTTDNSDSRVQITLDEDIDSTVVFNDRGNNVAIVDEDVENSTKNITLGNKDDVVIVEAGADNKYSQVNITGGTGADSIVVQGEMPVVFDMSKGGADKLITYAEANARVTLNNYDASEGAGIVVHDPEVTSIAKGIESGVLVFDNNKIVTVDMDEDSAGNDRLTEITVNDGNADGTIVRMFTYRDTKDSYTDDKGQIVGFTDKSGGTVDASAFSENVILIGNKDGKDKASSLKAGSGDDTIYAGKGDTIDAGEGDNVINLGGNGGANIIVGEGETTINNLKTGFDGDIINLGNDISINDVAFDGSNISIGGAVASVTTADVVNQLFEVNGQTVKAAIAADGKDITVSGSDVPDYFLGNAGVDFSNYSGDVVVNAKDDNWKASSVGDNAASFGSNFVSLKGGSGTTQFKGGDGNDYLVAGTGSTSLYGGNGNNTLVGNGTNATAAATEFFVLGNENGAKNTIEGFRFGTDLINTDFASNYISKVDASGDDVILQVTNRNNAALTETAVIEGGVDAGNIKIGSGNDVVAVGQIGSNSVNVDGEANYFAVTESNATVKVDSDVTGKAAIWLDNRNESMQFFAKAGAGYSAIDASGSSAEVELAGNAAANTITAGSGNASLWGGTGNANDLLVGGTGQNSFYYEQGDGRDTVNNAHDGDVVNLFDTSLENITAANITGTGVVFEFNNGGSLTVNSNAAVDYKLADGSTWTADHTNNTWNRKS
jgi:hypothetical protein